jgi:hypothetical protein
LEFALFTVVEREGCEVASVDVVVEVLLKADSAAAVVELTDAEPEVCVTVLVTVPVEVTVMVVAGTVVAVFVGCVLRVVVAVEPLPALSPPTKPLLEEYR